MMTGLNFNRSLFILFLAFVSYSYTPQALGQSKDEFSLFEKELDANSSAEVKPSSAPKSTEKKTSTPAKAISAPAAKATPAPSPIPAPAAKTALQPTKESPAPVSPAAQTQTTPTPVDAKIPETVAATVSTNSSEETSDQKIERLKKEIRSGPKNGALIVQLAEEFYKKEDYEKATLLLWKHVDKIDRKGLVLLAKAHEKRKEPNEMLRALNVLIGKDEKDFEAYSLMGNAYVMSRKTKDAMESYKKATELNPQYEPAYDGLIDLYEKREPPNLYELRILYQDMVQNIGPRPQYLRKLCEINTMDATYEPAVHACNEAIRKDPKVADGYVYLGISQKALGEDDVALKTLKKASKDFPKSELAQYQYGKLLEDQKNYVDAMKQYKAGTEADPQAARSWLGLATSSFEIRKFDLALIAFKNACKYDKKNAVAFRKATTILRNQKNSQWIGKFEDASETCTF
ncbi:O-linked GlcNAc transferase [Bdellovibrio bacteriovorus]|uniref:O-linked GlcNAc transferase n=1 Tax=Bdellovibrio bacteriovorus TaxID=959 RepID=A0A150WWB9_BDEBC|nr:tetratricopeptide repeat protein [Bdellovibrio bacteriovorus]KYG70798.1 O-linked GlcNAc transferase [Bdellovibrio bacteriovorus]